MSLGEGRFSEWSREGKIVRIVRVFCYTLWGIVNFVGLSNAQQTGYQKAGRLSHDLKSAELITDRSGLPQGFVADMVQDECGFLWMTTKDVLCRYDGREFRVFRPQTDAGNGGFSFSEMRFLNKDSEGIFWITSEKASVLRFDPKTEHFTDVSTRLFDQSSLDTLQIQNCFTDRQQRLWIALNSHGVVQYDIKSGTKRWFRHDPLRPESLISDHTRQVIQDHDGNIWIATRKGLERFEEKTGSFKHDCPPHLLLPEPEVSNLFLEPSGALLIGTPRYITRYDPRFKKSYAYRLPMDGETNWGYHFASDSKGRIYFDQRDRLFVFSAEKGPELLFRFTEETGVAASLMIDNSDVLWIGMDGSGIRKHDLRGNRFQTSPYQEGFLADMLTLGFNLSKEDISAIAYSNPYMFRYTNDQQGRVWITCGTSHFIRANEETRQIERITFPKSFSHVISAIATDPDGRIWVLYYTKELWYFDPKTSQWVKSDYSVDQKSVLTIEQMVVDREAFWMASQSRGLFRLDRKTREVTHYAYDSRQPASLNSDKIFCMNADPNNPDLLWIGTSGAGLCLFNKRTGRSRRLTTKEGLPNDVIYSAIPDAHGFLWIGTNKGIARLNRKTFTVQLYSTEDGLLANEFNRFHFISLPSGRIVMGGVKGITSFFPDQLEEDTFQPVSRLTGLYINNEQVLPRPGSFLSKEINYVDRLKLLYNQNFITLHFAAMQFNRPGKNRFRYQLEGVDANWVETSQPQAVYTDLSPGRYVFLLNSSNTSGKWSNDVRRLEIVITPPWWRTWWAYLVYIATIVGMITFGFMVYINRLRLQQAVDLRQQEARQLRELDELKSGFFTNITHDLRTPLTLILSPMDKLVEETSGSHLHKRLISVQKNARQLLNLINQLLDLSKIDSGALVLHPVRGDLGGFIVQTVELFREEAEKNGVNLVCEGTENTGDYLFDPVKLERVVLNLLINAMKYTPALGRISVSLNQQDGITLRIADTGAGIAPEKVPYIFDRFFQAGDQTGAMWSGNEGTGIGLALVKELVVLQGGTIEVKSKVGEGTTFVLSFSFEKVTNFRAISHATESVPDRIPAIPGESEVYVPHILIAEDNAELSAFVEESLPQNYHISRVFDGREALEHALSDLPDLIVSDVMMPEMDGNEFCRRLKTDPRTNHIPVILLTARYSMESRMEGLENGADEYLTKPFNVEELKQRIHNRLETQRNFRKRVRDELSQPGSVSPVPSNPFLGKVFASIEMHLDSSGFGVEQLAETMNMSRVHLHRKIKTLSGMTASDIVRNYRLKRSLEFLKEGFNSTETSYKVGFDSPSYFARCFRDLYGMAPGEYVKKGTPDL